MCFEAWIKKVSFCCQSLSLSILHITIQISADWTQTTCWLIFFFLLNSLDSYFLLQKQSRWVQFTQYHRIVVIVLIIYIHLSKYFVAKQRLGYGTTLVSLSLWKLHIPGLKLCVHPLLAVCPWTRRTTFLR
jgi:hypothetical protein